MGTKGVSDKQIIEILRRRNLPSEDGEFISRQLMARFLDGKLLDENPSTLARIIDVNEQVARLTGILGLHEHAVWPDGTRGHGEEAYQALWPKVVHVPLLTEFNHVALVDSTVPLSALAESGHLEWVGFDDKPTTCQWRDPEYRSPFSRRYVVLTALTSAQGADVNTGRGMLPLGLGEAVQMVGQSGGQFILSGTDYLIARKDQVYSFLTMGSEDGQCYNVVRVHLSDLKDNTTFTHNVLVRHQHIIPVD